MKTVAARALRVLTLAAILGTTAIPANAVAAPVRVTSARWQRILAQRGRLALSVQQPAAGFTPLYLTMETVVLFPSAWVGKMRPRENGKQFRMGPNTVVEARCPIRPVANDLANAQRQTRIQTDGRLRYDYTLRIGTPAGPAVQSGSLAAVLTIERMGGGSQRDEQVSCQITGPVNAYATADAWQSIFDLLDVPGMALR